MFRLSNISLLNILLSCLMLIAASARDSGGGVQESGIRSRPVTVTIKNVNSGLCVDTHGSSGNTVLVQESCSGASTQNFTLQASQASGYYYLVSAASSKCWDVSRGSRSAGALIQQYKCMPVWPEYFQFSAASSGFYRILSGNMSNGCIGVAGASTAPGAQIEQNNCNGSNNQVFQVSVAEGPPPAVSVSISPASASIVPSGSQQFAATVTGSTNTAFSWSATAGSISNSGLFTAPTVTTNTTVTVTATSQANTSSSASATVTVIAPSHLIGANPASLNFRNQNVGSTTTSSVVLTNNGNSNVTVSSVNVTGMGFAASGVSSGTILTPNQSATLNVTFAPAVAGSVTGSVTIVSNASNSPTAVALSGSGSLGLINVAAFGATGNGTTDDTAAIKGAIAALVSGGTLLFPCGTYLTSSQLFINVNNVTVDGSGCATIRNISSGTLMVIGGSGNGNPNYAPAVALSAAASELATSFTTVSSLGVNPGDYLLLQQGGMDSSTGSGNTGCDPSGCRGEVVQVASVLGNTVTVTTALHDTYNPSVNAAAARKILGPLNGMTVRNITLDGNGTNVYGLVMAGIGNSAVDGVTVRNVQGSALLNRGDFNVAWSNITVTGAGSAQCGSAAWFEAQGNLSVTGMSITNENPGAPYSGCLYNGAFGFELIQSANSTITNLTVDAAGAYGRPFKTTAARWNTFNSPVVKNGASVGNGMSLEYYSSHNTFNNCVVTNNGVGTGTGTGNAGINTFGNFNQYNIFNNCTVTGNGNVQFLINNFDALRLGQDTGNIINGGTYTGTNTAQPVIAVYGSSAYITSATINGPGVQGIYLGSTNACLNNNTFGALTGLGAAIRSSTSSNLGSGNVLNGLNSNLTPGSCTGP
jgi:Ricin-type beta-trefoil lectin domain-like/HYDIN/CFA65/VesB-like, Ig-like domain